MKNGKLKGVFAPVVTPFDNDELRYDWMEENLVRYGKTELAGYLALGTNGEFKSLTQEEKIRVVELFVKHKGRKTLMVGTGCESTRETMEFTKRVADLGADFASVLTPHYFASQMKDEALIGFYRSVADESKIPVLIYNIPKLAAGVAISSNAVKVLSAHPNIVGMKDSGGASIFSFLAGVDEGFSVLSGSADYFLPSLKMGATGGVVSLADSFPGICCELYNAAVSGDEKMALELHSRILKANSVVSGKYGVAGVKASMQLAGYKAGTPRKPLLPLSDEQVEEMRSKLQKIEFLE